MLHDKFCQKWSNDFGEVFEGFLTYICMAAILAMWPASSH